MIPTAAAAAPRMVLALHVDLALHPRLFPQLNAAQEPLMLPTAAAVAPRMAPALHVHPALPPKTSAAAVPNKWLTGHRKLIFQDG